MSPELSERTCDGQDLAVLEGEEIKRYLRELRLTWRVTQYKKIWHDFVFSDFNEAMYFVNEVAALAEGENHHPDIHIRFNKVKVELTTHSVGGLSENDFILASKIEFL